MGDTTVIKAWATHRHTSSGARIEMHAVVTACNGGEHYHLYVSDERKYSTLEAVDQALSEALYEASNMFGCLVWDSTTEKYSTEVVATSDDYPGIIRGEN